jgi:hypothetical protein
VREDRKKKKEENRLLLNQDLPSPLAPTPNSESEPQTVSIKFTKEDRMLKPVAKPSP